jgi:hypothetical protein
LKNGNIISNYKLNLVGRYCSPEICTILSPFSLAQNLVVRYCSPKIIFAERLDLSQKKNPRNYGPKSWRFIVRTISQFAQPQPQPYRRRLPVHRLIVDGSRRAVYLVLCGFCFSYLYLSFLFLRQQYCSKASSPATGQRSMLQSVSVGTTILRNPTKCLLRSR